MQPRGRDQHPPLDKTFIIKQLSGLNVDTRLLSLKSFNVCWNLYIYNMYNRRLESEWGVDKLIHKLPHTQDI